MALFGLGGSKTTVGLDIGSGLIKVVAIDHGKEPILSKVGVAPVLQDAIVEGEIMDPGVVGDAIRSAFEAAGLKPLREMTGQSLLPLLAGKTQRGRDLVFVERERHANVRAGNLSYPVRAVRTDDFLYLRNLRPDRWPAGDPEVWKAVGPFGDCDGSPSKEFILDHRNEPAFARFFQLGFAKRPAEELYDLAKDPHQISNVADHAEYAAAKKKLRATLDRWMKETKDPRATSDGDPWDSYPYFGSPR